MESELKKLGRDVTSATIDAVLKLIEPGERPCDCIKENADGSFTAKCGCQNSGSYADAAVWCSDKTHSKRIAALR